VLIASGGKGGDEKIPEATAMAEYLRRHGFPADALVLEPLSRNTEENLRFRRQSWTNASPAPTV
jgi:uncharacterized SAM-binding protein YcdF (DUF218 family)